MRLPVRALSFHPNPFPISPPLPWPEIRSPPSTLRSPGFPPGSRQPATPTISESASTVATSGTRIHSASRCIDQRRRLALALALALLARTRPPALPNAPAPPGNHVSQYCITRHRQYHTGIDLPSLLAWQTLELASLHAPPPPGRDWWDEESRGTATREAPGVRQTSCIIASLRHCSIGCESCVERGGAESGQAMALN